MKLRKLTDGQHPAATARLNNVPEEGDILDVPEDVGKWLLKRFPGQFAKVEEPQVPTFNTMGAEPEVCK